MNKRLIERRSAQIPRRISWLTNLPMRMKVAQQYSNKTNFQQTTIYLKEGKTVAKKSDLQKALEKHSLWNDVVKAALETLGVSTVEDLEKYITVEDLEKKGIPIVTARKIKEAFPGPEPVATTTPALEEEVAEGKPPSDTEVHDFARQVGMDPNMLSMVLMGSLASGAGMDMDLSAMMPIPVIVEGYNPKLRNINYMVLGQVERRLNAPIVIINADGSVNSQETVKYIMSLEEGFEAAPDNVYYDEAGTPYEVIRVGVDAQSIYDADPLDPSKPLQKNGMGTGRVNWSRVPLDVRQVVYYAVTQTRELNPADDTKLSWLRSNIGPEATRLNLRGEFPKALSIYNEAARTGALPTLRVQLSRTPRRPEVMPRRRTRTEGRPDEGIPFREEPPTF